MFFFGGICVLYPLNVDLTGRLIVVVGGGIVAERKVAGILAAGGMSVVRVIAPAVTAQLRVLADSGRIDWH